MLPPGFSKRGSGDGGNSDVLASCSFFFFRKRVLHAGAFRREAAPFCGTAPAVMNKVKEICNCRKQTTEKNG